MATNSAMQIKFANQKEIEDIFRMLPKGVRKPTFWQKLWKLNSKPAVTAAQALVPVSKKNHKFKFAGSGEKTIQSGTLKKSIGYFTTRSRRKGLGGYVGPRVKGRFKNANAGFYGNFVEWGDEVNHWGNPKFTEFIKPAWDQTKQRMEKNAMKDAMEIFYKETARWAKRTKKYGILGR